MWAPLKVNPLKTNISPENQCLEAEITFLRWSLFRGHVRLSTSVTSSPGYRAGLPCSYLVFFLGCKGIRIKSSLITVFFFERHQPCRIPTRTGFLRHLGEEPGAENGMAKDVCGLKVVEDEECFFSIK